MNTPIRLDIDRVIDAARSSGANDSTLEGLRQRLETMNTPPDHLANLAATGALKTLSRLWGGIFDEDPRATGEKREAMIAATRRALDQATEFPLGVLMGQWDYAAKFLESLTLRPDANCGLDEFQIQHNEQLREIAAQMRSMKSHYPHKTAQFAPAYNAHRVACVIACPFKGEGCEENFGCTETKWAFCRLDLESGRTR